MHTAKRLNAVCLALLASMVGTAVQMQAQSIERHFAPGAPPVALHPFALAHSAGELAGYPVHLLHARILRVIDAHAMVIESDPAFGPTLRDRGRVLVLMQRDRSLAIPPHPIATAPIAVVGVARTLLGIQAAHDVPWPATLTRRDVDRLGIRAAVLATSVQTPEGVELTAIAP
jgi:hypothetical protein